jgi:hypothetical protein
VAILPGRGLADCFLTSIPRATKYAIGQVDVSLPFDMTKRKYVLDSRHSSGTTHNCFKEG